MKDNYKFLSKIDVIGLKNKIKELPNEIWDEHTLRQTRFKPHKHTQTLEIMWDVDSLQTNKIGKIHSNYYKLDMELFLNKIKPIYESNYGEGYFVRVLLVKLKSNTNIATHTDKGESLINCKRTHVPIITNKLVSFTVNNEKKYMDEGEIWEIDNTKEHSVNNHSNEDRIHLIVDYNQIKTSLI
jgi:hypothetical protein